MELRFWKRNKKEEVVDTPDLDEVLQTLEGFVDFHSKTEFYVRNLKEVTRRKSELDFLEMVWYNLSAMKEMAERQSFTYAISFFDGTFRNLEKKIQESNKKVDALTVGWETTEKDWNEFCQDISFWKKENI